MPVTDGRASKRSQRTEETKVAKDSKDPHVAKGSQGAKTTVVSAAVTKSIMAKAVGAKMRESPRDDVAEAIPAATTTNMMPSAVADVPVSTADISAVTTE